jgi:fructose/tagatose bisphosphate aldolase
MGEDFVKGFIWTIERNYKNLPIVIHLDHGRNLEVILKPIRLRFSSVMIDGLNLDLEFQLKEKLDSLKVLIILKIQKKQRNLLN